MEDDPRNQLFRHFIDIVSAVNPKVIVFENVEGILSFQGGETYRNIIELFSELGYYTEGRKLLANHYGAPQRRKRVIILCTRKDIGVLPKDIYPEPITPNDDRQITAYETMYDLENVDCSEDAKYAKYASSYSSYILKFLKGEIEAEEYVKYVTDKRGVLSKTSQEAETDEDDEENDDLSTSAKTKGKDLQQESVQISLFDTV